MLDIDWSINYQLSILHFWLLQYFIYIYVIVKVFDMTYLIMYIFECQILKIILTSWLYGFLYNIYFQKVEILYFSRLIIYQASLLFDKWSMHSFIYFINNASENVIRTFGIFATKFIFILFIIPILFEMDIFCPFILVIRPTSINYVNTMNATFTSRRERA